MPSDLTAVGTITIVSRTVFGNKHVIIADVVIGDSGSDTWPSGGLTILPATLGLRTYDFVSMNSGSLLYHMTASSGLIDAYTPTDSSPGATKTFIKATGSAPYETVRLMAIGTGVNNS